MTRMLGYSIKAWWLAIGVPIAGFLAASVVGAIAAAALIVCCAECRRRWLRGARSTSLYAHHHSEVDHDR